MIRMRQDPRLLRNKCGLPHSEGAWEQGSGGDVQGEGGKRWQARKAPDLQMILMVRRGDRSVALTRIA